MQKRLQNGEKEFVPLPPVLDLGSSIGVRKSPGTRMWVVCGFAVL